MKGWILMLKFMVNLVELYLIAMVTFKVLRFVVRRSLGLSKKSKGKNEKKRLSLIGKVGLLISRQLHSRLDGMLTKQSEGFKVAREEKIKHKESLAKSEAQQDSKENIIQFSKYQRKVVK
jgi:uncharacterized metal-binding protein